ncbi:MAG: adenine-specific methyltransferase EcoRI family protein [bacterium]|nr:adenine-specific methyltransferase EcoRI family protein [bacterium]
MNEKSQNKNLHKASAAKNDEFYTQLTDIENELKYYKEQFRDKVVFCNCDDPKESNFVKYFSRNFEHLGLKKLIATHYKEANLFPQEAPYKLEYAGDKNGNRMPDPSEFMTEMIGTGDFRSEECIELLKEADIVVTNPPFSLFREYVAQLVEYKKKFIILGDQNAITYKDFFKLIKENKLWLGYDNGGTKWFQVPMDYDIPTESRIKIENGVKFFSMGRIVWFTNMETTKRHQELTLYKKFTPGEYPKYDNYEAINVDKVSDIPMGYSGMMGVPITFLDKYNPKQFEIIGIDRYIEDNPNYGRRFTINEKEIYARVVIKNKKVKK